jgi:peptidoglycan/LPS O-acetylase OafA/YrhL
MTGKRVHEIDLLRFLAAMAVVLFHYAFRGYAGDNMSSMPYPLLAPVAKYGYLGVELFFMISGFVILMTAAGGSLQGFVVSRVVRLYPAFWACCTVTFLVTLVLGGMHYSATFDEYVVNMTMLADFFGVTSIDGAYWSLYIEMRFYALVAVVLLLRQIRQAQWFLIFWLAASIALEIVPRYKLRYLLIVDYSAFFIAGATFYLIWAEGLTRTRAAMIFAAWPLAIFESIHWLPDADHRYHTHMSRFIVGEIVTGFFLVMLLVALKRTGVVGRKRWLLAGALTYPLYLLHQHIGFMIFNAAYPAVNAHVLLWGMIAAVLLAAFAVHVLVEKRLAAAMKQAINRFIERIPEGAVGPAAQ